MHIQSFHQMEILFVYFLNLIANLLYIYFYFLLLLLDIYDYHLLVHFQMHLFQNLLRYYNTDVLKLYRLFFFFQLFTFWQTREGDLVAVAGDATNDESDALAVGVSW